MSSTAWYKEGLSFSCTRCGNCCTGPPGYVWFNDDEAATIAGSLDLSIAEFRHRYAKRIDGKWSLAEVFRDGKYDCIFLTRDEQGRSGCSVYPVRPHQCRTWPFWPENLVRPADWHRVEEICPGIGEGQLYSIEKIRIIRDSHISE